MVNKGKQKAATKTAAKTDTKVAKSDTKAASVTTKRGGRVAQPKTTLKRAASKSADDKSNATTKQQKNTDTTATTTKIEKKKSVQNIVKVITKGGSAVDELLPGKEKYRVYQSGGVVYSSKLNQSNIFDNNNKFYIIQIVQLESNSQLFSFNRWGRVGVPGQQALKGPFMANMAIQEYNKKLREKLNGGYTALEIKYDDDEEEKKTDKKKIEKKSSKSDTKPKKKVESKLSKPVQDLINLIFDMNMIQQSMKEIGYDSKKMPLGKLGDSTIKQGYQVLNDLLQAIKNKKGQQSYGDLSGKFYSLIPHDFGFAKMQNFILDTEKKVEDKLEMLKSLTDLKLATKIIQENDDNSDDINQLDKNYAQLNNKLIHCDKNSADYKLIDEYISDSKSKSKIVDVFKLERDGEAGRYNRKLGNDQLLWHGSRLQNYVGILSQGLRIAPPEAPHNGYAYGKGLYFANNFCTSEGYCWSQQQGKDLLILLCEVALGREGNLLPHAQWSTGKGSCIDTSKHDSCLGFSAKHLPAKCFTTFDKMKVPIKSAQDASNAYIVYNINQARLKYVIRFKSGH